MDRDGSIGNLKTSSLPHLSQVAGNMLSWTSRFSAVIFIAMASTVGRGDVAAPPERVEFNRDIRPILAENCLGCHSADQHKAGLRLDLREIATKPLKSGQTAIVPNQPQNSELVQRITATD